MIRTVGSALLAKSLPGGKLRDVEEFARTKPEIPGKGQAGTLSRSLIEEPLTRQVPPGSAKIVGVQPTIEGTTVSSVRPPAPIPEAVQGPTVVSTVPKGAERQALFQSISPPATSQSQPTRPSSPQAQSANPVRVQGQPSETLRNQPTQPTAGNRLTTRVVAGEGNEQASQVPGFLRSGARYLSNQAANLIEGPLRNTAPELGISEKLRSFATKGPSDVFGNLFRNVLTFTPPLIGLRTNALLRSLLT